MKISEHFEDNEFKCPCCGQVNVSIKLLELLEKLRTNYNKPIHINSGYRCAKHNHAVGGVTNSQHTKGTAADVVIQGVLPIDVAFAARDVGFSGIGVYNNFTHLDVRDSDHICYWDNRDLK